MVRLLKPWMQSQKLLPFLRMKDLGVPAGHLESQAGVLG